MASRTSSGFFRMVEDPGKQNDIIRLTQIADDIHIEASIVDVDIQRIATKLRLSEVIVFRLDSDDTPALSRFASIEK
jgi:hypothetical protein